MSIRARLLVLAIGGGLPIVLIGLMLLWVVWSGNSGWHQLTGYAVVGLIVVFCTMTGALLIARSIARPVRLLNFVAEEFGGGNFSARAPTEGRDEIHGSE